MEPPNYESTVLSTFPASPPSSSEPGPSSGPSQSSPTHLALGHRGKTLHVPLRQSSASDTRYVFLSDVVKAVPSATGLVDGQGWQVPSELDADGNELSPVRWKVPDNLEQVKWRVYVPDKRDRTSSREDRGEGSSGGRTKRDDKMEKERQSAEKYGVGLEHSMDTSRNEQTLGVSLGVSPDFDEVHEEAAGGSASDVKNEFPRYVGRTLPSLREQDLQEGEAPPDFTDELSPAALESCDSGSDSDSEKSPRSSSHLDARLDSLSQQLTTLHHSLSDRMQAILMRLHTVYNRLGALESSNPGQPGPALVRRTTAPGAVVTAEPAPFPTPVFPEPAPPAFSETSTPPIQSPVPFRNEERHATLPPAFREVREARPAAAEVVGRGEAPPPYEGRE